MFNSLIISLSILLGILSYIVQFFICLTFICVSHEYKREYTTVILVVLSAIYLVFFAPIFSYYWGYYSYLESIG